MNDKITSPADENAEPSDAGTEKPEALTDEEQAELDSKAAEQEAEKAESEAEGKETENAESGTEPERPSRAKDRIKELVTRAKDAEARAEAAEKALARAEKRAASQDTPEPKPNDYEYGDQDANYVADLAAFRAAQTRKNERTQDAEDAKAEVEAAKQAAEQARADAYSERVAEFAANVPDFNEVVNRNVPCNQTMIDMIMDSENGPQIAYHLGKNPKEALEIARLSSERDVARHIGRIEARLTPVQPRKVSQAPKPIKAVADAPTPSGFHAATASVDDYEKHLRAKGVI